MKRTARQRRDAQKHASQFEEVTWDDLERTSLMSSLGELVAIAQRDARAAREREERSEQQTQARRDQARRDEERRERLRIDYLADAERRAQFDRRLEAARREAQHRAAGLREAYEAAQRARLARLAAEQELITRREAERAARMKTSLKRTLAGLAVAAAATLVWTIGSTDWIEERRLADLASLRIEANERASEAQAEALRLEQALALTEQLTARDRAQLEQAIRLAAQDAEAASAQALEFDRRKTAPRKLAKSPTPTEQQPTEQRPTDASANQNAPPRPTVAVNDFGMTQGDCDAYDPLCGNL